MTPARREFLGAAASAALHAGSTPRYLVETSIHLFSDDPKRFPYHRNATYRPAPQPLEKYAAFVREANLAHTVIAHSEVYQDDHRYLEYCFQHEPSPGFFKGTCLFDPIDPKTPERIRELVRRLPDRIVGIWIHELHARNTPSTTTGPMRDRDPRSPGMKNTWRTMRDLGLLVQMQAVPFYAPENRSPLYGQPEQL